uniref:hypothetical protein n=1 Tax=Altererythrobacter segetis TaxID=1104773 RepID=UPI00140B5F11|nr:hypothetical protein [Altererythrobacter segetis]
MRKIVFSSGLGLVAAAMPAHGAAVFPVAVEPAGVSEAGRVAFLQVGNTQGILIGLNKPGATEQIKQNAPAHKADSPYDKMKAEAQLKIQGQNKIGNTNQLKTEDQLKIKNESQLKIKNDAQLKLGTGSQLKVGGTDSIVRPNCLQPGQ